MLVEVERAEDGVHPGRGIRYERQAPFVRTEECSEGAACLVEQGLELPHHEAHRLALELGPQFGLPGQNRDGCGSEGAVVEKGDVAFEEPVLVHIGGSLVGY